MTLSLPSRSSASFVARIEPSASPSGFSWVIRRKRSRERIASATAPISLVVWGELIDQLRHADPALDRGIVFERQLRRPFHPQLARQPPLEHAVRRFEADEALLPLLLRAEHADVDARVPQVRRRVDAGHRHEADPGVLQLAHGLRQPLPDSLVETSHADGHNRYSSDASVAG